MPVGHVLMIILGIALVAAGLWWLGGGRWTWLPKPPSRSASMPTRMVVGMVHLLLGYHLIVWTFPADKGALQLPRERWLWVVLGCAGAVAASAGLDRLESKSSETSRGGDNSDDLTPES